MKFNILIIDEDLKVLKHIEDLLNKLKIDGEFIFAENINDALVIMEQKKINIVVSDIRLPQINEEDILEVIKNKYPSTIRIVLYDLDNKMQLMLKSIVSAHRYIAKPIELEKFNTVLLESIQLCTMLNNKNLSKIINKIGKFPALPQTYIEIEDELTKENFSLQKISEIVHNDMIITTRILQVVNSPFIGLPQDITDISQAVNLLGVTMIKSLILYVQIFSSYENNMRVEKIHREIWNHSLKVASNAKLLVANLGNKKDTETAYIAGLLHDIGKLIIINTEDYIYEILEVMKLENIEYNEAELKILGTTHAEIGGYLLSLWGLPKVIVESVLNHHNVSQTDSNKIDIVTSVYLANICADKTQMDTELLFENGFEKISSEVFALCG